MLGYNKHISSKKNFFVRQFFISWTTLHYVSEFCDTTH